MAGPTFSIPTGTSGSSNINIGNGGGGGSGGAPTTASYVLLASDTADLPNSFSLGSLVSGLIQNTVESNVSELTAIQPVTGSLLVGNSTTGQWNASAALTNGQLLIGNTSNPPSAATLTAGIGINITNSSGSITITAIAWGTSVSNVTMTAGHGYVCNNPITCYLPDAANVGDEFKIINNSAGTVNISRSPNVAQRINFAGVLTANDTTGKIVSVKQGDSLDIVCVVQNTNFVVVNSVGGFTVV